MLMTASKPAGRNEAPALATIPLQFITASARHAAPPEPPRAISSRPRHDLITTSPRSHRDLTRACVPGSDARARLPTSLAPVCRHAAVELVHGADAIAGKPLRLGVVLTDQFDNLHSDPALYAQLVFHAITIEDGAEVERTHAIVVVWRGGQQCGVAGSSVA